MMHRSVLALLAPMSFVPTQAFAETFDPLAHLLASGSNLLQQIDYDADGYETFYDISTTLYGRMIESPLYQADLDGDGLVTAQDTISLLEELIYASIGDVDASGSVSTEDVSEAASATTSGEFQQTADVTGDTMVNEQDVIATAVIVAEAELYEPLTTTTVSTLASHFYWTIEPQVMAELLDDGGGIAPYGSGRPGYWPDDSDQPHMTILSRTYPADHGSIWSNQFPTNHVYTITQNWPWDWTQMPPQMLVPFPRNHESDYSDTWWERPDGHSTDHSNQWRDHPNHVFTASSTWTEHEQAQSSVWPSNHQKSASDTQVWPSEDTHLTAISDSWTHQESVSGQWPPSHGTTVSGTWNPGHQVEASVAWPNNHSSQISGSWPNQLYPGHWPPNHNGAVSSNWDDEDGPTDPPIYDPSNWPDVHEYIPSAALSPK